MSRVLFAGNKEASGISVLPRCLLLLPFLLWALLASESTAVASDVQVDPASSNVTELQDSGTGGDSGNKNVSQVIMGQTDLFTFNKFLGATGVNPQIGRTIIAPNDEAFTSFENDRDTKDMYERFLVHPNYDLHRKIIIQWHLITEGTYTLQDIFDGSRTRLETTDGNITVIQQAEIDADRNAAVPLLDPSITEPMMDNVPVSAIVKPDIATSSTDAKIVHISKVLMIPPFLSEPLSEQLKNDRDRQYGLTTMLTLALSAGLGDEIDMIYDGGLTFLVPVNRRFNRAEIDVPAMQRPEMRDYTRDFVRCHMIAGNNWYEGKVFDRQKNERGLDQFLVQTQLGTHLWITTTERLLRFNAVPVLLPDQVAHNGVFHGLDYPLFPPMVSDLANITAAAKTKYDTSDFFRFFIAALMTSEDISLKHNSSLSVFAPTKEAFFYFNNLDYNRLLEPIWVRHLTQLLLNHISIPAKTREEFLAESPGNITMLSGETYDLGLRNNNSRIGNAEMIFGDMIGIDGYLHIIDDVLMLPAVAKSVYDQIKSNPNYSYLTENIDFVQLTRFVDRDLPLTVFAPDNAAFERVEFGTLDGGEILQQHMFRGLFFLDVLDNTTSIKSVNGATHAVERREDGELWVGGAKVTGGDVFARNGIVHFIDRVIGLDFPTAAPTITAMPTITGKPSAFQPPTDPPLLGPSASVRPPVLITFPPAVPTARDDEALQQAPVEEPSEGGKSLARFNRRSPRGSFVISGLLISVGLMMTMI